MNLAEAKKKAIQLINEYSNNGALISDSNNADYTLRMNTLAQSAQMEIISVRPIFAVHTVTQTATETPDFVRYTMPDDFIRPKRIIYEHDGTYEIFEDVRWEARRTLVLSSQLTGDFKIEYEKYPVEILADTVDYTFELEPDACEVIPYYLGAHVTMDEPDKQAVSSKLLAMYQQKMGNLRPDSRKRFEKIVNVMGW